MKAELLTTELGVALRRSMEHIGVPTLYAQSWHDAWELMVVDRTDLEYPVADVVTSLVQAMTHARELCRIYGHE